ncbi:hypothetical protein DER46DRAFT_593401 [Fusarium sp. MPI-SDFR-AT-0072]|nr:hypothetical protein DER46DRAFT_593401 [Fusarium sp. MPI-SDFR-AT-0072]
MRNDVLFAFFLFIYVIVVWSVGAAKAGAIRKFGVGDGTRWFVSRRLGPKGNGGSSNKQSSSSQRRAVCNMFADSVGDVANTWIESSSRSSSG